MFKRSSSVVIAAIIASAAPAAGVELVTTVAKEQRSAQADGTSTIALVHASRAAPGDTLVYTIRYRNMTGAPVAGILVDDPLPSGVTFLAPAAGTPPPELSVDGRSFGALGALTMPTPTGLRPATVADVSHLRWHVSGETLAGSGGQLSFKAILK